jgi:hypothetical protein
VTSRLIGVMEREIDMLRTMRPSEMQNLQQDKIVLAAAYESSMAAMRDTVGDLDAVDPALRRELKETTLRFQEVLSANEQALRAARDATDRVLKAIVSELERSRGANAGYGASGATASLAGGASRASLAVSVDQRL